MSRPPYLTDGNCPECHKPVWIGLHSKGNPILLSPDPQAEYGDFFFVGTRLLGCSAYHPGGYLIHKCPKPLDAKKEKG